QNYQPPLEPEVCANESMETSYPNQGSISDLASASGCQAPFFVEGVSPCMRALEVAMRELAQDDIPVLLLSESGAGKRTIVRQIHQMSGWSPEAFRLFQCAGLDELAFENPRALMAGGGTIFLEEIGELSAANQARLIAALSELQSNGSRLARLICGSAQ